VSAREEALESLDDGQIRKSSLALRYRVRSGEPVEAVLDEAYALVREVARRRLGMRHFDVQILGGIAMHHGSIAVMQTGEGKTLTAVLPMYVAALSGEGAHLATANDYLASRDAKWMGPIYQALGMKVGVVTADTARPQRRDAYACDVTYSTAKDIGFDFLRDRLLIRQQEEGLASGIAALVDQSTASADQPVQRGLNFVVVDEADSILIDEARTPLIISSLDDQLARQRRPLFDWAASVARQFEEPDHYEYEQKYHRCTLNDAGRKLARQLPKPDELAAVPMLTMYDQLETAILVEHFFLFDRHYVIRDGEVVIVDEFTGRMAEGRKWRAGLHQAIEAKEHVTVTPETNEAARITIQSLFASYKRLAGMTGTVANSSRELYKIYRTPVATIPTHKPARREQWPDRIFGNADAKWNAIADEVAQLHHLGRPVLVGTRSIDKSEHFSKLLTERNIPHEVLNARQLAREAEIVAQAGQVGRVTVATNMAGRGTDIQLADKSRELGGLHVICSELHESARIDRQLIGRCGRQGDPGTFRCYMSLDDDLIMSGWGPRRAERLKKLGAGHQEMSLQWSRLMVAAQRRVERKHFRSRKLLLYHERQRQKIQREMGQDPYVDMVTS